MSTKLTYTGAEVQELLDKIEKGDFDNAKTLEGHPASYFAIASEFTSLAESFATEQGRVNTLYSYFNNGSANDALSLGGQLPSYYATALQYEILQQTLTDFKSLFDSMFEKDSTGNIHAKLSLWSSGGITAGGVGSGGSGGGGGISYNRLDSWSDYSADKAGYVLSALLGKDLDDRVSALANAGYVTASALAPYALRSEIPSLVGYATQSWVESKNYLTGITSAMVTTALGYTPYNSANFTKANIKTTLGISDWALASAKPTYTASEVGALGVNGTAQSALKMTPEYLTDLNSAAPWRFFDMNTGYGSADGNKPNIAWVSGITGTVAGSSNYRWQLATTTGNARPYFRQESKGNWSNWGALAFTSDIPTKLSQLTDDVVAGKYLSLAGGTVNGSITATSFIGNLAGTASGNLPLTGGIMAKNSYIDWGNTDGFEDYVAYSNGFKILGYNAGSDDYRGGIHVGVRYGWQLTRNASSEVFQIRNYSPSSTSWGDWKTLAFTDSNVASATKLATPRTIWGQSFDGTGDITGPLHLGNNISLRSYSTSGSKISTLILDPSNTLLLGYDMSNIGGTVLYGKALAMRYGTSRTMGFLLNEYGNVAIGGTTADTKLHVYGNGKFEGSVTASSLTIGGATITYDSANEALCINGNMYALGGVTAGGAGISTYSSLESRVARIEQQLNIS